MSVTSTRDGRKRRGPTRDSWRVQDETEVLVAKLLLDRIVVNNTRIENNRKEPHHCEHEGQHNGHDCEPMVMRTELELMVGRESEQNHVRNCQVEFS